MSFWSDIKHEKANIPHNSISTMPKNGVPLDLLNSAENITTVDTLTAVVIFLLLVSEEYFFFCNFTNTTISYIVKKINPNIIDQKRTFIFACSLLYASQKTTEIYQTESVHSFKYLRLDLLSKKHNKDNTIYDAVNTKFSRVFPKKTVRMQHTDTKKICDVTVSWLCPSSTLGQE